MSVNTYDGFEFKWRRRTFFNSRRWKCTQWNHRIYVPKIESPVKTRQMLILCVTKQRLVSFNLHRHRYPFNTRVCFLVCTRFVPTYLGSRRMKVRSHRLLGERSVRGVHDVTHFNAHSLSKVPEHQLSCITPSLITYSFAIIPFDEHNRYGRETSFHQCEPRTLDRASFRVTAGE